MAQGNGDWWACSYPGRPTFFLDADVQGIVTETSARLVASKVMFGVAHDYHYRAIEVQHLGRERAEDDTMRHP